MIVAYRKLRGKLCFEYFDVNLDIWMDVINLNYDCVWFVPGTYDEIESYLDLGKVEA